MTSNYLGTFEQVVLLALASVEGDADGMSVYTFNCQDQTPDRLELRSSSRR